MYENVLAWDMAHGDCSITNMSYDMAFGGGGREQCLAEAGESTDSGTGHSRLVSGPAAY